MGSPLGLATGCIDDASKHHIPQGYSFSKMGNGSKDDSNIKEVLSAFPKDNISKQIKDTVQDVPCPCHLGLHPISCDLQVLHSLIQILMIFHQNWVTLCFCYG